MNAHALDWLADELEVWSRRFDAAAWWDASHALAELAEDARQFAEDARFDDRLSAFLDRAIAQLEAADDPDVIRIYRALVDDLEQIALPEGDG